MHNMSPEGLYRFEPGEAIGWRYEGIKKIDEGAFGIVIKAKDCKKDRIVALKLTTSSNIAVD